jgi:hypothetical protein
MLYEQDNYKKSQKFHCQLLLNMADHIKLIGGKYLSFHWDVKNKESERVAKIMVNEDGRSTFL